MEKSINITSLSNESLKALFVNCYKMGVNALNAGMTELYTLYLAQYNQIAAELTKRGEAIPLI